MKTICILPGSVSSSFREALRKIPNNPNFAMDRPKKGPLVTTYTFEGDIEATVKNTLHNSDFELDETSKSKGKTVLHYRIKT
jgi:hypothetical protein